MLVFVEGGKPEFSKKNPRSKDQTHSYDDSIEPELHWWQPRSQGLSSSRPPGAMRDPRNEVALVGGERSYCSAISAPQFQWSLANCW